MIAALAAFLRIILFLALAGTLVAFITANPQAVTVSLYPAPYELAMKLHTLCLLLLLAGFLLGVCGSWAMGLSRKVRLDRKATTRKKQMHAMEQELQALRLETRTPSSTPIPPSLPANDPAS